MKPLNQTTNAKIATIFLAALAWFSIGLQWYLTTGSTINFFSYFTIQCNLLIAVSLTFSSLFPNTNMGKFFSGLSVQSAIALYIFIVCLVYNLVLRGLYILQGWQLFVDTLLHVVVPILYILYWFFFRSKGILKWKNGIYWVFYPLIYLVYSLIRGHFADWYPYPFLNVMELGYGKVFVNIAIMIGVFLIAGLVFIFITRIIKHKS